MYVFCENRIIFFPVVMAVAIVFYNVYFHSCV
jgi:hypothetical protein